MDVPLDDVLETGADAEVDGTTAATTESTDDEDARVVAGLCLALLDSLLHIIDEKALVLVAGDTGKRLVLAVLELPGPGKESEGSASKASVVAECCNTASVLVLEELEVKEGSLALGEAAEDGVPTTLVLVACVCQYHRWRQSRKYQYSRTNSERIERAVFKSVITVILRGLLI